MANDHDPFGRALDELRTDVAHVTLASPADVRARGEQRTRRHRAALGAGTVVVVAAIAVGASALPGSLLSGGRTAVPPAGGTPTAPTTASPKPSPSSTAPSTPTDTRPVIDVSPVGVGHVPAAYFLPGKLWTGPDLVHGAKIRSIEPKEFEGSVQRFACDPDTDLAGDVAFVQAVRRDGTFVGTQKVRLLSTAGAATDVATQLATDLPRCQDRLRTLAAKEAGPLAPGETAPNPTAEVTEDAAARVDDANGSVRLYRTVTDYGTGAGSRLIEWVAIAREGSAVTLISVNQFEKGDVSFAALQRIADDARAQMAWAATQR
jgi:hypothetical protein